ncbi:MAG: diaminopimelate decarboxylase [Bauldia sp.]|nr:diaminopimelate decarboxylase [Bauldia sp.]
MRVLDDYLATGAWRDLVREYETPLVIVDAAIIRERARALRRAFAGAKLFYAPKANYNPHIVRLIVEEGFGIDAVSPMEIRLGTTLGVEPKHIVYVENAMSPADMGYAIAEGVRMVLGSLGAVQRYCVAKPNSEVSLRVNGDIGASSHHYTFTAGPKTKFGIHVTQLADARAICAAHGVKITGLQQHIGSNWLDPEPFVAAAEALVVIAKAFPDVTMLDFGGGFGIPYRLEDHRLDVDALGEGIRHLLRSHKTHSGRDYEIGFEPGRYLVAESSAILTTVHDRKIGSTGRVFIGTDTGFNHLIRPALYNSYHRILNLTGADRETERVDVCGNLCEESDYLARDRILPSAKEGDVLAIMDSGAYGLAQAGDYNLRLIPPEVLVDGDSHRLIRKRRTFNDVMAQFDV